MKIFLKKESLHIKNASCEQLHELAVFLDNCWKVFYRNILDKAYLDALSSDARHQRLLKHFNEKPSDFLVLCDTNSIAGAVIFKGEEDSKEGEIAALYLREDLHGQGHGHRLLAQAEEALFARGHRRIVLEVFVENTSAIRFYQSHGYSKVKENRMVVDGHAFPPSLVMRKEIA